MLDPKEEAKFARLRSLCQELKMPCPPEIHIGLQVHDQKNILTYEDIQRGHSWTRNFYNFCLGFPIDVIGSGDTTFGASKRSGKSTNGSIVGSANSTVSRGSNTLYGNGLHENSASGSFGIKVGTGSTAFSVENFALATVIAPGNAASQLAHQPMVYPIVSYADKVWTNVISRIFNNNSGGEITVREIALYSSVHIFGGSGTFMMERSVLETPVLIANGAQLTVSYTLTMDFSAID